MVYTPQDKPYGEVFIRMNSEQSAESAARNKHKRFILIRDKECSVDVFPLSEEDMNLVLTNNSNALSALPAAQLPSQPTGTPRITYTV